MKTLTVQGVVTTISSKADRSLRVSFVTPELTTAERSIFMEVQNVNSLFTIKPLEEPNAEEVKIDKELEGKPLSVRLRNVLFVLWKQDNENHNEFNEYYKSKMNGFIEHLKTKIEETK